MRSLRCVSIVLLFVACAASQRDNEPWRVELQTEGGIAGRGLGSIIVSSDGKVSVTTMQRQTCELNATAEELRALTDAIARAKPEAWQESYVPEDPCCDRIGYTLTLNGKTTKWIDDPKPRPADLVAVADATRELMAKFSERCR